MVKAIYFAVAILLCAIPQKLNAQAVNSQDSLALVDLYNSTNGASWVNKTNWLSGQVKDWNGVTVVSGRVAGVSLDLNNLTGTLPNSLGDMSNIQIFEIGDNQISGEIPVTLGNWSNLLKVDLDNNLFTGSFPAFLTSLVLLESIEIDNNMLSGPIPSTIGNLTKLKNFDLDSNMFSGPLPAEIGNLNLMTALDLSDNGFSGTIPNTYTNLLSLQELYLDDNMLTGSIPTGFSNLSTLVRLDLRNNMLSGNLPGDITNYPSIKRLLLGNNQLTGTIPSQISNNTFLTRLDLSDNNLSGSIPSSITSLTLLSRLYLTNSGLSGEIPSDIGNMPSLKELELNLNNFTGSIPTSLGNATKLEILFLDDNLLTGQIPPSLGNVLTLTNIELDGNMLTGNIPPELGNLVNLLELDVDNNQLTGQIPSSLGGMAALTQLNVDNNQLSGAIPSSIFNIVGLRIVEIGFNMFDSLPDNIGNATEMRRLLAERNNFNSVPASLSNLTNLTRLRLDSNELSDLPDLSGMTNMKVLTLHDNQFQFDDLIGNISSDSVSSYSPQADISAPATVDKNAGESWTNSISVAGSGNVYQWYLNGNPYSGATSNTLDISSLDSSHSGTWVLHSTNPAVPNLTIKTSPTILNVQGSVNSPPSATNDFASTDKGVAVLVNVVNNDSDPDGDDLSLDSITRNPLNGSSAIEGGTSIRYTPNGAFVGRDSLEYSISDASDSSTAWLVIEVIETNLAPNAVDDVVATDEGVAVLVNVLANDSDPNGDNISLDSISTDPTNGTAAIEGGNSIRYTPNGSFVGRDSLQYSISDASASSSAWLIIVVTAVGVNTPPVANNDFAETDANVDVLVNVLANDNDPNGDDISLDNISMDPMNGTAAIEGGVSIRYTPNGGFVGRDSLEYSISDASDSSTAWMVIEVKSPVSVDGERPTDTFWVGDNYPNPFQTITSLEFGLPRPGHVVLKIYNLLGQEVGSLLDGNLSQGVHKEVIDVNLPSGSYIFILSWEDQIVSKNLTIQ